MCEIEPSPLLDTNILDSLASPSSVFTLSLSADISATSTSSEDLDTEGSIINELATATLAAASCPDSSEVTRFEHSPSHADSKIQNLLKNRK